jgi:hypothetical protein
MNIEPLKRLPQAQIDKNMAYYNMLKHVEDYSANNNTLSTLQALYDTVKANQDAEQQAEHKYQKMRNKAVLAEWNFHNAMLMFKDEIKKKFECGIPELRARSGSTVTEVTDQK